LFLKNLENKQIRQLALMIFSALLLVLPAGSIGRNLPKIIILKNDFTAEELGRDILSSLPENSILIPGGDTVVFDSQYVHYGLGLRSDVLLLEWFFLGDKKYQARVLKKYQALNLELKDSNDDSLTAFIKKNMDKYPIYSNTEKSLEGLKHVPEGLSLRFYRPEATPSAQEVFDKNQAIAAGFQDYKNSSLNKYANLFLLNTKSVYSQAYLRLFLYFLDIGEYDKAEFFADKYTAFNGVSNVSGQLNFYLGEMYLGKNDCAKAEEYFQKAKQEFPDSPLPDAFLRKTYAECFNDPASAGEYLDSCLDLEKEAQPKLDEL